jgi:hypothetical protein
MFDGTPVALWGVRVPTVEEMCSSPDGSRWACGAYAISALYSRVAGQFVWCVRKARRPDSIAAQCYIGIVDVAQALVEHGWAMADVRETSRYVSAEAESRRANRGMWKSAVALAGRVVDRGTGARVGVRRSRRGVARQELHQSLQVRGALLRGSPIQIGELAAHARKFGGVFETQKNEVRGFALDGLQERT